MNGIDIETKRKLREMGAAPMLEALEAQDETLVLGMAFEERLRLVVDEAHSGFNHAKVEGLIRRAGLRYPGADLRRLDLVDERGLDRNVIAQLGTLFVHRTAAERRVSGIHRIREVVPGVRSGQAGLPAPDPGPLRPHARP